MHLLTKLLHKRCVRVKLLSAIAMVAVFSCADLSEHSKVKDPISNDISTLSDNLSMESHQKSGLMYTFPSPDVRIKLTTSDRSYPSPTEAGGAAVSYTPPGAPEKDTTPLLDDFGASNAGMPPVPNVRRDVYTYYRLQFMDDGYPVRWS